MSGNLINGLCTASRRRHVLASLLCLLMIVPLQVMADFLPSSPETFVKRLRYVLESKDNAVMMGLYNWERVGGDTRTMISSEVEDLMQLRVTSVDLMPLPPSVTSEIVSNGKRYEMNLEPERMIVIQHETEAGPSIVGLPIGKTLDGYAIGISLEVDDAPVEQAAIATAKAAPAVAASAKPVPPAAASKAKPTLRVQELAVIVVAGESVVTEVACAYYDLPNGDRQVKTWKASGSFTRHVSGSEFVTCAAKKRGGDGATQVSLSEFGATVFSQSATDTQNALIYRPK